MSERDEELYALQDEEHESCALPDAAREPGYCNGGCRDRAFRRWHNGDKPKSRPLAGNDDFGLWENQFVQENWGNLQ